MKEKAEALINIFTHYLNWQESIKSKIITSVEVKYISKSDAHSTYLNTSHKFGYKKFMHSAISKVSEIDNNIYLENTEILDSFTQDLSSLKYYSSLKKNQIRINNFR